MNIIALETQNHGQDWPMIVMAVACPICGAPPLERCKTVRSENPQANHLINAGIERADWHAARKYAAARAWYEQADERERLAKESAAPIPTASPERPRTKKGSAKKP
jgi:hypothetical protein